MFSSNVLLYSFPELGYSGTSIARYGQIDTCILNSTQFMKRLCSLAIAALLPLAAHATTYTFSDVQDGTSSTFNSLTDGTAYTWGLQQSSVTTGNTLAALETAIHNGSQSISSVTLTLTGISDWTIEPYDVLYVDILNGLQTGAHSTSYYSYSGADTTAYSSDPFNTGSVANGQLAGVSGHVTYLSTTAAPSSYGSALIAGTSVTSGGGWTNPATSPYVNPGTFSALNTTATYTITYTLSTANDALLKTLLGNDATGGTTAGDVLGLGLGPDCHFNDTGISLTINTSNSVPDNGTTLALLGFALLALAGYAKKLKSFARN